MAARLSALSLLEDDAEQAREATGATALGSAVAVPGRRIRGDSHVAADALLSDTALKAAAVLVPLVERPTGLTIILTQRTSHLAEHAGQISFPGGRLEPDDIDETAGALRETEEEIGLAPAQVRIIGRLDTYVTGSGYRIAPIVGLIRPPLRLTPDPHEVAEIFEVPLGFVVNPANHQRQARQHNGRRREFYVLPYAERYIWGATAAMLVNLSELLSLGR